MKKITGAQGAFIVRILMESYQAKNKRLMEAGFTGQKKDKLGRTRYYQDGRQVKNPNAAQKADIKAAAGQPLPAGQAPSHTDAATRVDALQADTPPQQVKALANDLMNMDVKDLKKMAQDEPQKRTSYAGENGDVIQTPGGYIDIQFQKNSTSPRKQSVIGFVVDEDKRGQGIGDKLLKQAKQKYPDLGGQVSSKASLKVFYNNGFRSPDMPEASFAETLQHWQNEGGSLYMAANDENGKPYATGNEPKQSTASTNPTSELSPEQIENYKNLIASIEKQLDPTKTDLSRYSQEKINGVISKLNDYRAKIGLPPYQTNNKAEETPPAPAAPAPTPPPAGMNPEALALDALRLKQNRKPHNAAHITQDAVAGLKAKGLIDDANKITGKGREQLYAAKNKTVRKATGPKAATTPTGPAPETGLSADANALEALRLKSNRKQHIAGHITPEAIASLKKQGFIDDNNKLTPAGRVHLYAEKGSKMPAQPGAPKAKRASRNKDSLISIVRRKGGINSDSVKAGYDYKNDIIEGGLLHAIRKQGMGLDEMAQTLMVEGHIIVPEGVDPGEHLLNEMKARHNSALKDTTKEIDLEQEAYYKAKQAALEGGHDERSIEGSGRSGVQAGESAGQEEGYRALDEWDNSGAGTQSGGETSAAVTGDGYDSSAGDDYDRNATTGPIDTSFDFGFNAQPKDETPAEPTPKPAPTASEPEPAATTPKEPTTDEILKRHLQRQGFTGIDAQGREWQNGELVAAQPEEPKQKRAAAGGEIGPNGEHYRGGAFIATTELPKRLKDKIKQAAGDGMVKVTDPKTGNTTRETPPSSNLMSISASMIGTFISPRGDVNHNYLDSLEDRGASYDLRTKINELARKYKAGEKWVPINDYPEIAKGADIYRLADAGLPIHPELLKRMPEEFKDYYIYQKSSEELKNDSAREDFDKIKIGDKFKDKTGKEYVIHKKGPGTIRAWPLINGEPRPSSEKKFAITAAAKQHYPDHEKSVSLEDFTQAASAPAEQNKEIETDPARQQQIKNSIAHGELILKYGKKVSGQKYSTDELNAVVKSLNSERAKLGEPGFTGIDAQGREWRNGELVAKKDEPAKTPNTDLFGNPTKPTPKGPETMPGLFGDQVPVAPDAPTPTAGEPLPGSDNPLDRPGAGRGKQDGTQDMFGLFGPGTKAKVDAINNGPDPVTEPSTPAAAADQDQPNDTPRTKAARVSTALAGDFENARDSAVPNMGVDLKGSARHRAMAWKGLKDAEANGTAEALVRRDELLKHEPSNLFTVLKPETSLSVLTSHLAMQAFPKEVHQYEKYVRSTKDQVSTPAQLREQYYEAFTEIKKLSEDLATQGKTPKEITAALKTKVSDLIDKFRKKGQGEQASYYLTKGTPHYLDGDRYNPVANSLADMYNRLANTGSTSVMGRVNDFGKRLQAANGNAPPTLETLHTATKAVGDILEGKSFNQAFDTVQKKGAGFDYSAAYGDEIIRKGGKKINMEEQSKDRPGSKVFMDDMKVRGVQFGNSLPDQERIYHAEKSAEALSDLTDILGLPEEAAGLGGKLGLAIGARGRAGAKAHFEPWQADDKANPSTGGPVINLTRASGAGSLAHEWGHGLDHFAAGNEPGETKFLSEGRGTPKTVEAMRKVQEAMDSSGFSQRLKIALRGELQSKYWYSDTEKFARTFERHVQNKLRNADRENTYLTGLKHSVHPYWPNNDEMAHIAPHMDALIAAIAAEKFPGHTMPAPAPAAPKTATPAPTTAASKEEKPKFAMDAWKQRGSNKKETPYQSFEAIHGRPPTFQELHGEPGGLLEKQKNKTMQTTPTQPNDQWVDVTPAGYGPSDDTPPPAATENPKPAPTASTPSALTPSTPPAEIARSKPKTTITFNTPITGPSGAKIDSYDWKHKILDELDKNDGEKAKRVSDWEKSIYSDATNKEIVHHFHVTMPDGSSKTVSLESAIKLLGYTPDSVGAEQLKSSANAVKTLAKAKMHLLIAQAAAAENKKIKDEVARMTPPPITVKKGYYFGKPDPKGNTYFMGDTKISRLANDNSTKQEIEDVLKHSWQTDQLRKKGGDVYDYHGQMAQALEKRVKKLEKNLNVNSLGAQTTEPTKLRATASKDSESPITASAPVKSWAQKKFKNPEHAQNFAKWFGDSKVVNDQGEPLVLYHGTSSNFDEFKPSTKGMLGPGIYASAKQDEYGPYSPYAQRDNAQVKPLYMTLKNPHIAIAGDLKTFDAPDDTDGTILIDRNTKKILWAIAKTPNLVKSALGNQGTFDPNSPKITESTDPHAEKIKLVQAIIARRGIKPPKPKAPPASKKTAEASSDADPRVKRIRELMDAYC